ncbi:MAG: hypothetical protein ACI9YE_001635 [Psychroserpens sp.]|jgi:hypothetical protein
MKLLWLMLSFLFVGSCFSQDSISTEPINIIETYSQVYNPFCANPVEAERASRAILDSLSTHPSRVVTNTG